MQQISSITMKELEDATDQNYLKHRQRTDALKEPTLLRCFANTIITRVPSSKFSENHIYWHQYFMLTDLKGLVKKNGWPLEEAVRFAIEEGDIHCFCDCHAWLYWGDKYFATAGGYTYGAYREFRAPTRNNVEGRNLSCKHNSKAMEYLRSHIDEVVTWFKEYYNLSLKKAPEKKASEDTAPARDIPEKPRYVSRSSNKNDVEVAYEDETTDTIYIPSEKEKEEITELAQDDAELEQDIQDAQSEIEAQPDSDFQDIVEDTESDDGVIDDTPDEEGLV